MYPAYSTGALCDPPLQPGTLTSAGCFPSILCLPGDGFQAAHSKLSLPLHRLHSFHEFHKNLPRFLLNEAMTHPAGRPVNAPNRSTCNRSSTVPPGQGKDFRDHAFNWKIWTKVKKTVHIIQLPSFQGC